MSQKSLQMTLAALWRCRDDPPQWPFSKAASEPSLFGYHTMYLRSIVKWLDLITLISDFWIFSYNICLPLFSVSVSQNMGKT